MTIPSLDGHNDALTAEWHDALAVRRDTGHIDLPRMREGGVRAAFFAVFASPEEWPEPGPSGYPPQPDAHGGERFDLVPPISFELAAGGMATRMGATFCLHKPFRLKELLQAIAHCLTASAASRETPEPAFPPVARDHESQGGLPLA